MLRMQKNLLFINESFFQYGSSKKESRKEDGKESCKEAGKEDSQEGDKEAGQEGSSEEESGSKEGSSKEDDQAKDCSEEEIVATEPSARFETTQHPRSRVLCFVFCHHAHRGRVVWWIRARVGKEAASRSDAARIRPHLSLSRHSPPPISMK
jgi:hypothetical protein